MVPLPFLMGSYFVRSSSLKSWIHFFEKRNISWSICMISGIETSREPELFN